AVAKGTFWTAQLSHQTTGLILAVVEITSTGVIALVEASDRHYQHEAIKRFIDLVTGIALDAADPLGGLGAMKECLIALRDVLRARARDARTADDVFARERLYQQLTHLAGLQVEQLTMVIRESVD